MGSAMLHISKPSHVSLLRNRPSLGNVTTVDIKAMFDLRASIFLLIKQVVNFLCLITNVLNLHSTRVAAAKKSAKIQNSRWFSPLSLLSQPIILQRLYKKLMMAPTTKTMVIQMIPMMTMMILMLSWECLALWKSRRWSSWLPLLPFSL